MRCNRLRRAGGLGVWQSATTGASATKGRLASGSGGANHARRPLTRPPLPPLPLGPPPGPMHSYAQLIAEAVGTACTVAIDGWGTCGRAPVDCPPPARLRHTQRPRVLHAHNLIAPPPTPPPRRRDRYPAKK